MKFTLLPITDENIPNCEVLAKNKYSDFLVGYITKNGDDFECNAENTLLDYITHFAYLNETDVPKYAVNKPEELLEIDADSFATSQETFNIHQIRKQAHIMGALSETTKKYWFNQFVLENPIMYLIPLTQENMPMEEVFAVNEFGNCLVGTIFENLIYGGFSVEHETQGVFMNSVTHFAFLPKYLKVSI